MFQFNWDVPFILYIRPTLHKSYRLCRKIKSLLAEVDVTRKQIIDRHGTRNSLR